MIDIWEIRNEEVYDKEEAAKQQKQKNQDINQCLETAQFTRPGPTKQCISIISGRKRGNRTYNSSLVRGFHCNENQTNY